MPEQKLRQLQYEADTWKRLLGFMMEENIHLKNRVSEILRKDFDSRYLEVIADFQDRFIKEDQRIGLLRNEVAELDKLLASDFFDDRHTLNTIQHKLNKVRDNITNAERNLSKLKKAFNHYILGTM